MGESVFSIDGHGWEFLRGILRPQFSRNQISQLENLEEHVRTMMECIPEGEAIDIQSYFMDLTMDTASHFLLGESCKVLEHRRALFRGERVPEDSKETIGPKFAQAFDCAQEGLIKRFFLRNLADWHNPQEFQEAAKHIHKVVDGFVQAELDRIKAEDKTDESKKDRKFTLVSGVVGQSPNIDRIVLRNLLTSNLIAGRDTTASTLSWAFYLLLRYPETEKKLRAAIREDFGDEGDSKPITFETLKRCKYLRWVIDETSRLYPTVPMTSRLTLKDTTLPLGGGPDQKSPIFVPKGTYVDFVPYAVHRREDIWGPDANWFRPERWGEPRNSKEWNYFDYLPFGGGPRICIGQQFALTEISYMMVRLFQHFKRFEIAELNEFTRGHQTLTMCVGGNGVMVKCYRD
ncbi:hypothetical protein ABW20_dc0101348 [Dactylellina cionopaga]|nr:hypothetical protein ABW20_dc0101348 [Dactylellina cionopaga]